MTVEKRQELIRSASPDEPLLNALIELIDERFEEAVPYALIPDLSPDARSYNSGRAAALRDLTIELADLRTA